MRWAVGMAGKEQAGTQPADSPPGTGFKRTAHSWPALQQKQPLQINVGLSLAVQVRGGSAMFSGRRVQTYLTCPYPTYRLCLSLSLPTPLICKTQFSPKLTSFFFRFYFYPLLPTIDSSPNPL